LVDLLVDARTELFELAVRSGLKVLETMLEEDRVALCGARSAHVVDRQASRAGTVSSEVVLGGRKVAVRRPRVRADVALRFLAAALAAGERALFVSTREDRDAIRRICQREPALHVCLAPNGKFAPDFRVVYLHPEYIPPGKFCWDLIRLCKGGHADGEPRPASRLAFDNIARLQDRFPLIQDQRFLIAALLDLLRYEGITPLFVDMVPPAGTAGASSFDPSTYLVGFDNVMHVWFDQARDGPQPMFRVLKSVGNDYTTAPVPIEWRRT
jgi:hypothetical protein